jgi:O-antigen ligase
VVLAACVRGAQAFVVQRIAVAETGGKWETATSHGDSVLFAVAAFLLVVDCLERPARARLARTAALLPIVLVGAMENNRRLVWVMLGLMLLVAYLVAPMRGWKRAVTRLVAMALPAALLYVGVGWNRGERIFSPVQTLRSVADTSANRSAYWREVEAWNIAMSTRFRPILGMGLGGEYTEFILNDDISDAYKEYREWPHNSVLGLLMLMGVLAFTAHWLLLPLVAFLAVRALRRARDPEDRVAAFACLGAVAACLVMAYGDTGAHYAQHKTFVALAVAVAAKLAVSTGAWPARARAR